MKNFDIFNRTKSKAKQSVVGDMNTPTTSHEGIRTIQMEELREFSANSELRICIVTWNMNGKVSTQDLTDLVANTQNYDLLVIGLQEVPRCNIAQQLEKILFESHSLLRESIMQSVQLFVFGSKKYELLIGKEIKIDKYAAGGLGGLIRRKKGAVGISITVKHIRMVFITCHLSAHAHNVEERNSQSRLISHSLFSKKQNPYSRAPHITVWLGDLNYRIQGIQNFPVRNLIKQDLHKLLTNKDQLLQEAERGQIFEGYCEGTLGFKPTYKYNVGSSNYDTSKKVRVPAWTDRILYNVEKSGDIEATLHSYESLDHIHGSDHKPVKAILSLNHNELGQPRNSK